MQKPLPTTYLFLSIIIICVLHFSFPVTTPIKGLYRLLGLIPLGLGITLNLIADQSFKRHQTTVKPFDSSSILITEGVFQWSRNPMYLGMTLILLGIVTLLGSISPFIVLCLFVILMDVVFIRPEEAKMEKEFGDAFRQYKQKIRRWI